MRKVVVFTILLLSVGLFLGTGKSDGFDPFQKPSGSLPSRKSVKALSAPHPLPPPQISNKNSYKAEDFSLLGVVNGFCIVKNNRNPGRLLFWKKGRKYFGCKVEDGKGIVCGERK